MIESAPMSNPKDSILLRACPFCGGQASFATVHYTKSTMLAQGWEGSGERYYINCNECDANNKGLLGRKAPRIAADHWNSRVTFSQSVGLAETGGGAVVGVSPSPCASTDAAASSLILSGTAEKMKVMAAFEAGKKIQVRPKGSGAWTRLSRSRAPEWNWENCDYREEPVPREFWLNMYAATRIAHDTEAVARADAGPYCSECIKVREVLE